MDHLHNVFVPLAESLNYGMWYDMHGNKEKLLIIIAQENESNISESDITMSFPPI